MNKSRTTRPSSQSNPAEPGAANSELRYRSATALPGQSRSSSDHAHDHGPCLADALARAEKYFAARGIRLTALRRQVFEEIAASHDAVGAYDVLDRLQRKTGERMAPISVYRALDVLLQAGVVHRLESRNAFFACHVPHAGTREHVALVCESCGMVAEVDGAAVFKAVASVTRNVGFEGHRVVAEVVGKCAPCSGRTQPAEQP
jgi:Fur family zinc uptake transcriptional regulator